MSYHAVERIGHLRITFAEFKANFGQYRLPWWWQVYECLPGYRHLPDVGQMGWRSTQWYRLAVVLRIRVPNAMGFFADGPDAVGASWCWPWQFYRRYYEVRVVARGWGA